MSALTINFSDLSPEVQAMLVRDGVVQVNGQAAPKSSNGRAKAQPKAKVVEDTSWTNAVGYSCANDFLAWKSSNEVARHLSGACGCRFGNGSKCKALKKGRVKAEDFGTQPEVSLVKNEKARTVSFA